MAEKNLFIVQLEQAFRRKSWHGTNLFGAVRGIGVETAAWRPAPDRHNIWEIILHAAYWKYSVYRRLDGDPKLKFPVKGSNWFPRPAESSEAELKADIKLLKNYHDLLIGGVNALPEKKLGTIPAGSKTTFRDLLIGVAAHDLYHAGQIQLLKRLQK